MNWLFFIFALEAGFFPNASFVMYEMPVEEVFDLGMYVQIEAEVLFFDLFFVGGSIRTYVWKKEEGISFWPWRDGFMFNAGLRYKILELGFRHYCTHPVIPYQYPAQMNWEGAYEEIYFRIEGRIQN